jgi:flagellar biosynthesis chaperone FliJ
MKSLTTLIRIKQREMDALKRQQGILESQREEVVKIIDGLANQLISELKAAQDMPDMAHFFGNYSASIKQRQEMMHGHLRRVEVELDKLSLQLRERFGEMKKFELALANWKKRRDDAQKHREQQEMDEIGIRGYIRRDAQ